MKLLIPLLALLLLMACFKKPETATTEIHIIERDTDILDEEDLEELPEN